MERIINWSIAPHGTTHYDSSSESLGDMSVWEKHARKRCYFWNDEEKSWEYFNDKANVQMKNRIARIDNERGFTNEVVEDDLGGRSVENVTVINNVTNESLIQQTLKQRGSRYGKFEDHAKCAQNLQDVMRNHVSSTGETGWSKLSPSAKQSLTVIADKIARILNGDATYDDNWIDIQGYAKLEENILKGVENHG